MTTHRWDMSVASETIKGLQVDVDGSKRASQAWASGGASSNTAFIVRSYNPTLLNAGFAMFESVLTDRSNESSTAALQSYANRKVAQARSTTETWSFSVRADVVPVVGEYRVGDLAQIIIGDDDPIIAAGTYTRRILGFTTDQDGVWVSITTGEVYSANGAAV